MSSKGAFGNLALPFVFDYRMTTEQPVDGYYHSHQAAELLYVHQGQGKVVVRERTYAMKPGALFVFQPYQLHRVHADIAEDAPYVRTILHFMPAVMEEQLRGFPELHRFFTHLCQGRLSRQLFGLDAAGGGQRLLESLLSDHADRPDHRTDSQSEEAALVFAQLIQLIRRQYGQSDKADREDREDSTPPNGAARHSEQIMKWINSHYDERFDLEELAAALHLSKFHLSRVFRAETGSSITEYLIARRLKEACRLLRTTSLAIDSIGLEVGVGNASYFSQLFRKHIGVTPHEYRKRK